MTTPRPSLSGDSGKGWLRYDLRDLPPLRWYREKFPPILAANAEARSEGKATLFRDLEQSVRVGVPIDLALEAVANVRVFEEFGRDRTSGKKVLRATKVRQLTGFFIFASTLLILVLGPPIALPLPFVIALLFAMRVPSDQLCRQLARRLQPGVRKGLSLSAAMESFPYDYTEREVRLVRMGESSGRLAECLASLHLSSRQGVDQFRLSDRALFYSVFLLMVSTLIGSFLFLKVVPKYEDIFRQMNFELPWITLLFYSIPSYLSTTWLWPVWLGIVYMMYRGLLTGLAGSRAVFSFLVIILSVQAFYILLRVLWLLAFNQLPVKGSEATTGIIILSIVLTLMFLPALLNGADTLLARIERFLSNTVRHLPILSHPHRLLAEAEWIAGFGMGITSGGTIPQALQLAAESCDGRLRHRTRQAAADAERGLGLTEVLEKHSVLSETVRLRIGLVQSTGDPSGYIADLADDQARHAGIAFAVSTQVSAIILHLLVCLFILFILLAIYLPLFELPHYLQKYHV